MNNIVYDNKKAFVFPLLILIMVALWYFYGKDIWSVPENIETKLLFLHQQKDIAKRDFYAIAESMQLQKRQENNVALPIIKESPIKQVEQNTPKEKEPAKPLQLRAVVNQKALINETWYQIHSIISHDEKEFIVQKITKDSVYLQDRIDSKKSLYLEMFRMPEELFLQVQ